MSKVEIDDLLLKNTVSLARIEEKIDGVPVVISNAVTGALGSHVEAYHKVSRPPRPSLNGYSKLVKILGGVIVALTALVVALTQIL